LLTKGLHVVHYNSELYPNLSAAMAQRDGLAVLGILIKVFIPAFDVQSLLPKDLGRYYRYNGSLTTPPCYQSVIWTLFHERVQISKAQVRFRHRHTTGIADRMLLQDNYRTTQALNHRVVFASFSAGQTESFCVRK
uniref:Carbonic anhydrase XIV n=1 Tax=Acanthochromis polyacanthus TaxID=80966 RepID=A0A3Q1G6Q0_9TELE